MLDWDDVRSFLAIARAGTLSGAARTLNVRQSTMSRRLEALEARTGARLFLKTPSGFILTPTGEGILGHAERMEAEALSVERAITGHDVRLDGTIRIATVETLGVLVLLPILAAFRTRYPGIRLEVVTGNQTLSLTKREADVALRFARLTQNDLAVRKVASVGFGLYAAPAYLERRGQPDFSAGAPGHTTVMTDEDQMHLPEMAMFAELTAQAVVAVRGNSRFLHRDATAAGMGIGCLERFLGDREPGLVRLDPPPGVTPPARDLWLAVHNDTRRTPRIRALTDFVTDEIRRRSDLLDPA